MKNVMYDQKKWKIQLS